MREATFELSFYDNPVEEEYSIDIRSENGSTGLAEIAVGRSRKAAITKAKKALQQLLKDVEGLGEEGDDGAGSAEDEN